MLPDPNVSRQHLVVWATPRGAFLRDLGSQNGTYVGGRRVGPGRRRSRPASTSGSASPISRLRSEAADVGSAQACGRSDRRDGRRCSPAYPGSRRAGGESVRRRPKCPVRTCAERHRRPVPVSRRPRRARRGGRRWAIRGPPNRPASSGGSKTGLVIGGIIARADRGDGRHRRAGAAGRGRQPGDADPDRAPGRARRPPAPTAAPKPVAVRSDGDRSPEAVRYGREAGRSYGNSGRSRQADRCRPARAAEACRRA